MIHTSRRFGVFAASVSAAVVAAALVAPAAQAVTLDFDSQGGTVANGYGGLDWANFYTLDATTYDASGYVNGLVSPKLVALNGFGNPASISGSGFTLNSGYFTAAWNDGLTVDAQGFVGGVLTFSKTFVIDTAGPTLEAFNWANLSGVTFTSSGGVSHGYNGGGEHFALDNLTVNESGAVPEPASWALMLGGFGMVGGAMRARRRTAVAFG